MSIVKLHAQDLGGGVGSKHHI